MRPRALSSKGFTLIEVVVTASLATIISGVIMSLYVVSQGNFSAGTAFLQIHSNTRMAMDWMAKDIRWGTRVVSTRTISAQNYTTGDNELIVQIPAIDASGDIIDIDNTFDYIVYHLNTNDPTQLERIVDADAASSRSDESHIVANAVNAILFSSGGTGLSSISDVTTLTNVEISLTAQKTAAFENRVFNNTVESIIELRNKE